MPYKTKTKASSVGLGIIGGLGASWTITLLLAALSTVLIASEQAGEEAIAPISVATVLLSVFIGALLAAGRVRSHRMLVCLSVGGAYFVGQMACNVLFFGGAFRGVLPALFMIVGIATLAGAVGTHKKGKKYRHFSTRY